MNNKPIGILGGTFDPVHYGHLRLALELYQQLDWREVRLIPCQQPVLGKIPQAAPAQRLAMLQRAIAQQSGLVIDERELQRATPSYTADTLLSLRAELGNSVSLCLVLGSDTLVDLPRWHRWQELIQLAHWVIIPRPGWEIAALDPVGRLIQQQQITDPFQLHRSAAGHIFIAKSLTPLAISASAIRQQIAAGFSPRYLLPDAVWEYIQQQKLYLKNTI